MGLIAGLFYAWACSVMPGLARTTDRTFVEAMHHMNQAIINPVLLRHLPRRGPRRRGGVFPRAKHRVAGRRHLDPGRCRARAVMFVVTMALNVPLNDGRSNSFEAGRTDFAATVRSSRAHGSRGTSCGPWRLPGPSRASSAPCCSTGRRRPNARARKEGVAGGVLRRRPASSPPSRRPAPAHPARPRPAAGGRACRSA